MGWEPANSTPPSPVQGGHGALAGPGGVKSPRGQLLSFGPWVGPKHLWGGVLAMTLNSRVRGWRAVSVLRARTVMQTGDGTLVNECGSLVVLGLIRRAH